MSLCFRVKLCKTHGFSRHFATWSTPLPGFHGCRSSLAAQNGCQVFKEFPAGGPMSCWWGPTPNHTLGRSARLLAPALSPDWNLTEAERWRLGVRDQGHMFLLQGGTSFIFACHLIREIMRIHCWLLTPGWLGYGIRVDNGWLTGIWTIQKDTLGYSVEGCPQLTAGLHLATPVAELSQLSQRGKRPCILWGEVCLANGQP